MPNELVNLVLDEVSLIIGDASPANKLARVSIWKSDDFRPRTGGVHEIVDLELSEVSAVDHPANAGAKMVLLKADSKQRQLREVEAQIAQLKLEIAAMKAAAPKRKEPPMTATPDTVYDALAKAARAQHPGLNEAQAVDRFLASDTGKMFHRLYDQAGDIAKANASVTKARAEDTLDALATQISKAAGISFEQAYDRALQANPDLYVR